MDESSTNQELLISSWHARNELYAELFGQYNSVSPPDYASAHINEQNLAVLSYAPDPLRPYWTYVTAGLSTPWLQDEEQEVSGFGIELMIKSPQEGNWPAQVLRTMAYYVFNHMGTFSPGVRLALNGSIIPNGNSLLRNVLIWYADEAPDAWYQLPSGGFGIFTAIGITDDEMKLTESMHEEYGAWCMLQILGQLGIGQITDPERESVIQRENISSIINSVKGFAEQFHQASPTANQIQSNDIDERN